ncbi:MAG: hypothetical protein ABIO91_00485 [Pyrinomonadaceae bacterium]
MIKKKVLSALVFAVCIIGAASAAQAQGRYANVYSRTNIDSFIQNLENSSDVFSRDFKSSGGTSTGDRRIVDRFENAVDRLRSRFNNSNGWWESRNDVQGIMTEARLVNIMMSNDRFARRLERQWRDLRRDINKLADTYELPDLNGQNGGGYNDGGYNGGGYNGGGNNGGGYNNGGGATRPPSWAVGTWYWVQGQGRVFSINPKGVVTENANGYSNTGSYRRGSIYLNGNRSTVTRTSNGIRTYNTATGETSDYTRGDYPAGGGGYGGNNGGYGNNNGNNSGYGGDGNMSRPPNWALGTWTWVQGSGRQFTVEANGRVVENTVGGGLSYGSYYNGVITLNGNASTVTRTRDGIRTYNQSTGETSDYVRQ